MKLCVPIPSIRGLLWRHSADVSDLVRLSETLLPEVTDHLEYVLFTLLHIHLGNLNVKIDSDVALRSTVGTFENRLKFVAACSRFYYVEYKFQEYVASCLQDSDVGGSKFVAQRGSYMIVEQR